MRAVILAGGPSKQLKHVLGYEGSRSLLRFPGRRLLEDLVAEAKRLYDDVVVVSDDRRVVEACTYSGCVFAQQVGSGVESAICAGLSGLASDTYITIIYGDIYAAPGFIETHTAKLLSEYEPTITLTRPIVLRGSFMRLSADPVSSTVEKVGEGAYVYAGLLSVHSQLLREKLCSSGWSIEKLVKHLAETRRLVANLWLGTWIDLDTVWDYLAAVRIDLEKLGKTAISPKAKIGRNVVIEGPVVIEENAVIDHGAVIKGPAYIGNGAFVGAHSFVRGGSALYNQARVGAFTEIKRSIVYDNGVVYSYSYIADSIIGAGAEVKPYTMTLNVPYEGLEGEVVIMSTHPLEKLKVGAVVSAGVSTRYRDTLQPATIYTGQ